jgi:hypothetical protein
MENECLGGESQKDFLLEVWRAGAPQPGGLSPPLRDNLAGA